MNKFIVIEGIDGCGGQTQTNLLRNKLGKENTLFLSFPSYETDLGQIVDKFLHKKILYKEKDIEILVYYADILQHKHEIKEALEKGMNVVCDRYFTSTITFQSLAGRNIKEILALNNLFELPIPDICFLLDISAEESQKRKSFEKGGLEILDRNEADLNFLKQVKQRYLEIAENQIFCKWEVINGELSINQVEGKINNFIEKI